MVDRRPTSAAAALYPHLPSADRGPVQRAAQPASVAAAMYPDLVPKPPQPRSAPRPVRSKEWVWDWSNVDERYARMVGLIPKGRR